jgi:hypothetical protein
MRKALIGLAALSALILPAASRAQQQDPAPQPAPQNTSQAAPPTNSSGAAPQQSVADAARKAKEQKTDAQAAPKTPRVFDNDNIPTQGGISSVGSSHSGGSDDSDKTSSGDTKANGGLSGKDEKGWRDLFAKLRKKQEQDEAELEIDQRELGVDNVQFYTDPVKGMQQGLTRSDINDKTAKIDEVKRRIEADKQAISDAEEQLRAAGGDSGWSR